MILCTANHNRPEADELASWNPSKKKILQVQFKMCLRNSYLFLTERKGFGPRLTVAARPKEVRTKTSGDWCVGLE